MSMLALAHALLDRFPGDARHLRAEQAAAAGGEQHHEHEHDPDAAQPVRERAPEGHALREAVDPLGVEVGGDVE